MYVSQSWVLPQMSNCISQQPEPPGTLSRTRLGGWSSLEEHSLLEPKVSRADGTTCFLIPPSPPRQCCGRFLGDLDQFPLPGKAHVFSETPCVCAARPRQVCGL